MDFSRRILVSWAIWIGIVDYEDRYRSSNDTGEMLKDFSARATASGNGLLQRQCMFGCGMGRRLLFIGVELQHKEN
jgi:hypothetical protein